MSKRPTVQVVKRGNDHWEITAYRQLWDHDPNSWLYELIARVLRGDDGLYYVERPTWKKTGNDWHREPRGFQLPIGAFNAAINGSTGQTTPSA